MRWSFHGLTIEGATDSAALRARWQRSFASRPPSSAVPDISCALQIVSAVPPPPPGDPRFRQGALLEYHFDGGRVVAHFPRYGQLRLDLAGGRTEGQLVQAALDTYGAFEDLIAIGLSPHLRRRGMFLIHAFAAATGPAALIVGGIGAGKTTSGMALLNAGWKLLSNDSPIVGPAAEVLSYPGLLAAYPDSFARIGLRAGQIAPTQGDGLVAPGPPDPGGKVVAAAEQIWPDVWIERAPAGAIFFPQIELEAAGHALEPVAPPEALRRIVPHAIERWDREMIPTHLALLNQLVQAAPAYRLRLGPAPAALPEILASALAGDSPPGRR